MKTPWTKAIEKLASKMQNTIDRMSLVIIQETKKTHEKSMGQLNLLKRSEQIKYNRINQRLIDLETMFESELKHYRKQLELQEISAATDAEKANL